MNHLLYDTRRQSHEIDTLNNNLLCKPLLMLCDKSYLLVSK